MLLEGFQWNLMGMFRTQHSPSVVIFQGGLNPIWPPWQPSWKTYFKLKLRFYWRCFNETWWECSVPIPDQVLLFFKLILITKMAAMAAILKNLFQTLTQVPLGGFQRNLMEMFRTHPRSIVVIFKVSFKSNMATMAAILKNLFYSVTHLPFEGFQWNLIIGLSSHDTGNSKECF